MPVRSMAVTVARQQRNAPVLVLPESWVNSGVAWVELPELANSTQLCWKELTTESTTVVTAFGWPLPYLVWSHTEPNKRVASTVSSMSEITVCALTIQHNDPINTNFPYLFICLTHEKSVVRSLSLGDIPLVTSNVFPAPQYSSFCGLRWDSLTPSVLPTLVTVTSYYALSHFLTFLPSFWYVLGHSYSLLYSCNGIFFNPYTLTRLLAMQYPQPEDVFPEFPSQPQSFQLHSRDFRQQEIPTNHHVDPRSVQLDDPSISVSGDRNPNGIPVTMDQRYLANSATLPQHCPPYLGSASGPLTGFAHVPYFPTAGFTQGNNYIGVLNIESPTHCKQSKKRKRSGGDSPSKRRKGKNNISYKEVY